MKDIRYAQISKSEKREQRTDEEKERTEAERRYQLEEDENSIYEYDLRCIKAKEEHR